jgi:hypothetical protein
MPRGRKRAPRATLEVRDERIQDTLRLLAERRPILELRSQLSKKWGIVPTGVNAYIAWAREHAAKVKLVTMTPEERAVEQNLAIEGIRASVYLARTRKVSGKERPDILGIREGSKALAQIFGAYKDQVELTGAGGGPVQVSGDAGLTDHLTRLLEGAEKRSKPE